MKYILGFCLKVLPFMLVSGVTALLFKLNKIKKASFEGQSGYVKKQVLSIIYIMFVVGLLSQTVLPEILFKDGRLQIMLAEYGDPNLQPFRVFTLVKNDYVNGSNYSFWINFLANVLLFLPIGFLKSLTSYSFFKGVSTTFFLSLFIEVVQYFIGRCSDIDDLILNTLGGLLGALLWLAISRTKFALELKKEKLKE